MKRKRFSHYFYQINLGYWRLVNLFIQLYYSYYNKVRYNIVEPVQSIVEIYSTTESNEQNNTTNNHNTLQKKYIIH